MLRDVLVLDDCALFKFEINGCLFECLFLLKRFEVILEVSLHVAKRVFAVPFLALELLFKVVGPSCYVYWPL